MKSKHGWDVLVWSGQWGWQTMCKPFSNLGAAKEATFAESAGGFVPVIIRRW